MAGSSAAGSSGAGETIRRLLEDTICNALVYHVIMTHSLRY